jgi:hypothetical protein
LCSWNTLANTDRCTLYYNVSVLRVRGHFTCFIPSHIRAFSIAIDFAQSLLPQPRIASTLMVLDPLLKKETSLKVTHALLFRLIM